MSVRYYYGNFENILLSNVAINELALICLERFSDRCGKDASLNRDKTERFYRELTSFDELIARQATNFNKGKYKSFDEWRPVAAKEWDNFALNILSFEIEFFARYMAAAESCGNNELLAGISNLKDSDFRDFWTLNEKHIGQFDGKIFNKKKLYKQNLLKSNYEPACPELLRLGSEIAALSAEKIKTGNVRSAYMAYGWNIALLFDDKIKSRMKGE